jgi:hypothetical protein
MVSDLSRSMAYSAKVYNLDSLLIHFEFIIPVSDIRFQYIILPGQNTIQKILEKLSPAAATAEKGD